MHINRLNLIKLFFSQRCQLVSCSLLAALLACEANHKKVVMMVDGGALGWYFYDGTGCCQYCSTSTVYKLYRIYLVGRWIPSHTYFCCKSTVPGYRGVLNLVIDHTPRLEIIFCDINIYQYQVVMYQEMNVLLQVSIIQEVQSIGGCLF